MVVNALFNTGFRCVLDLDSICKNQALLFRIFQ